MASAAMPASASPHHDPARGERSNQVQYIEESVPNDIWPAAVAGISALLAQLETQATLPSLAVSLVADVAGFKRTMTCRNGVWYGCDLTHPFLDDRSTVVRGPSVNNSIEQEATLRLPIANVVMPQLLPPAHMVPRMQAPPQPQPPPLQLPTVQPLAFSSSHLASYASAPAAQAPHMILSSTSNRSSRAPVKCIALEYTQHHLLLATSLPRHVAPNAE